MKHIKDLKNQVFGTLLVLQLDKEKSSTRKFWKCKCLNCGKEISVRQDNLQKAKSCGCLKQKDAIHYKDHTGQRFGKLTVMYITDRRNTQNRPYWHCKCDCGNEVDVLLTNLQSGNTTSCGCINSKGQMKIGLLLKENNIPFEKQKTFENFRYKDSNELVRFDFYVNNEYLLEYDGIQHFQYSGSGWDNEQTFRKTTERDEIRNNWCREHCIPLIRIPYTQYENLSLEDLLLETSKFKVV